MRLAVATRSALALALTVAAACGSDPREEARGLARDPLACEVPTDCCTVVDGCRAEVYVVHARDQATAAGLIADAPDDMCLACITPAVQVDCVDHVCVAQKYEPGAGATGGPGALSENHCGPAVVPDGWVPALASTAHGLPVFTVIGCD